MQQVSYRRNSPRLFISYRRFSKRLKSSPYIDFKLQRNYARSFPQLTTIGKNELNISLQYLCDINTILRDFLVKIYKIHGLLRWTKKKNERERNSLWMWVSKWWKLCKYFILLKQMNGHHPFLKMPLIIFQRECQHDFHLWSEMKYRLSHYQIST